MMIKDSIDKFIKDYKSSNNKSVFFLNNRKNILIAVASFAFSLGLIGYIVSDQTNGFFDVLNSTIALFWGDFKDDNNILLDLAKSLAFLCVFSGAIFLFFSNKVNDWIVKNVQKKPYNLVIGLSNQNQHYINSLESTDTPADCRTDKKSDKSFKPSKNSTLIIEANANHDAVERYRKKGFGVISSKAEEAIGTLDNLDNLTQCFISTGSDRQNIALALKLIKKISTNKKRSIYVRVDNRDLSVLFQDHIKVIGSQTEKGIDLIPHSLQTIICRQLFEEHSVLGLQTDLIDSNQSFNIIVVGASKLAIEIIYHLAILAHLPNQNHLTIHLIDAEAKKFCANIEKRFPGISQIPQLTLAPLELDSESLEFYRDAIWYRANLTNIVIATDTDDKNLDIAVNLQDTTYIQETTQEGQFHTQVLFAISSHTGLGSKISDNNETFANFYAFGDLSQALTEGNLIDEGLELIAGLIHFHGYKSYKLHTDKDVDQNIVHKEWTKISLHEKESNRSQALHIDIKLLSLGLEKTKSKAGSLKDRYEANQAVFDHALVDINSTEKIPTNNTENNSSKSFSNLLDKLSRAEHNRWNAFHYLRGWQYCEDTDKKAKLHKCLKPLEEFNDDLFENTYKYDLYSIQNIPLYLAHAKYEIVEIQREE